jgi:hypothetical protein
MRQVIPIRLFLLLRHSQSQNHPLVFKMSLKRKAQDVVSEEAKKLKQNSLVTASLDLEAIFN